MDEDVKRYLNVETGLNRLRGNAGLYKRMLGMLMTGAEFDALEEAIASGDMAKASNAAHAIKGMAGNLSLDAVADYADLLTESFRAGGYDETELQEYRDTLAKTQEYIKAYLESD